MQIIASPKFCKVRLYHESPDFPDILLYMILYYFIFILMAQLLLQANLNEYGKEQFILRSN